MTPPAKRPVLKTREFLQRMAALGVEIRRGEGSEVKLYRPGYRLYTIRGHGGGEDLYPHVVKLACRRLGIDLDEFWSGL